MANEMSEVEASLVEIEKLIREGYVISEMWVTSG